MGKRQINDDFKKTFRMIALVHKIQESKLSWIFQETSEFMFSAWSPTKRRKLSWIFQETSEFMFSAWSPTKRRKPVFRNTLVLKFELVYLPEMRVDMT